MHSCSHTQEGAGAVHCACCSRQEPLAQAHALPIDNANRMSADCGDGMPEASNRPALACYLPARARLTAPQLAIATAMQHQL